MKTIKGNLILKQNTTYDEDLKVEGNIEGYFNLKVIGNIDCRNIDCRNIDCLDINCRNIDCLDINCLDINCRAIVFCNKIKCKKEIKAKKFKKNYDCYNCSDCSDCYNCYKKKNKKYMICNVQFTKEEYEAWKKNLI